MSLLLRFHPNDRVSVGDAVFTVAAEPARLVSSTGEAIALSEADTPLLEGVTVGIARPAPFPGLVLRFTAPRDVTIIRLPRSIDQ